MTTPAQRMRNILNYTPQYVKMSIPAKELHVGDLWYGDKVTRIRKDEFFVTFWTEGRGELPQGFYPDFNLDIERKSNE